MANERGIGEGTEGKDASIPSSGSQLLERIRAQGGIGMIDTAGATLVVPAGFPLPVVTSGQPAVDLVANLHGDEIRIPDLIKKATGDSLVIPANSSGKLTVVSLVVILGDTPDTVQAINTSVSSGSLKIALEHGWIKAITTDEDVKLAESQAYLPMNAKDRALEVLGGNPDAVGETGIVMDARVFLANHPDIKEGDPYMQQLFKVAALFDIALEGTYAIAESIGTKKWQIFASGGALTEEGNLDPEKLAKSMDRKSLNLLAKGVGVSNPENVPNVKALAYMIVEVMKAKEKV